MTPINTYLIAVLCTFIPVWLLFFLLRKDQRNEMCKVGLLIGILSVITSYLWWTEDWWAPQTVTATRVGIEDFLIGFFAGGVMSSGYEIAQRLTDVSDVKLQKLGRVHAYLILFSLTIVCSVLFWVVEISSALACFIALAFGIMYTYIVRSDLWKISIGSGIVMLLCSLPFYGFLILVAPEWIQVTYPFEVLTGFRIYNVPIEEFLFWFLAGMVFGPFYEVMNGLRERRR